MRLAPALSVLVLAATAAAPAAGQSRTSDDPWMAYERLLQISGRDVVTSFTVRAGADSELEGADHPWANRVLDPVEEGWVIHGARVRTFFQSDVPRHELDGPVWQGKGGTVALDGGAGYRSDRFRFDLRPVLGAAQNASYDLGPARAEQRTVFSYPWRVIDWPQRFGYSAAPILDLGQSEAAVRLGPVEVGASTRGMVWGPSRWNPIVMSDGAAGVPHGFIASDGPIRTRLGDLRGRWVWGHLSHTKFFDPSGTEPNRFLTGIVLDYSPDFAPGLTVGATRVFQVEIPNSGVPFGEFFLIFQGLVKSGQSTAQNPSGTDARDQVASLYARWVLEDSGLELYGEYGRNDHSLNFADLILEPEHSRGITLGFQKVVLDDGTRLVALHAEHTTLEATPTFQLRPRPTWYEHGLVEHGYTHRGQLLGAPIGPGGSQQTLGVDAYGPHGLFGGRLTRRVHDNDAFYENAPSNGWSFDRHHASLDATLHWMRFRGAVEWGAHVTLTREFNRYYDDREGWNVGMGVSARWVPRG